jgi:hypothetical protein
MPAKLLLPNRVDATEFKNRETFDGSIQPQPGHPLRRSLLASKAVPSSILPQIRPPEQARLLGAAFPKDAEHFEDVVVVLVNPEDEIRTLNCARRVNSDDLVGEQIMQMDALISEGYALVGLLVQPPSGQIDDYKDASGVLRWPAETWESSRSVDESKRLIAQVAQQLVPTSYHLRHVPEEIGSNGDPKSSVGKTS